MSQWTAAPVRRAALFSVVAVGLVGTWLALLGSTWRGTASEHAMLETAAFCLALFAALMAIVRYHSRCDEPFLYLAAAFVGTALLDGYHAAVAAGWLSRLLRAEVESVLGWSWTVSRLYFAAMLLLSWIATRRPRPGRTSGRLPGTGVCIASFVFCVGATVCLSFAPLPPAHVASTAFPRPLEFVSGVLFAVALVGYSSNNRWQTDPLESWIIVALVVSVAAQGLYISRSAAFYDAMFYAAHILKVLSYACVVTGLLIDVYGTLRRVDRAADELTHESAQRRQAEHDLHDERRNLRLALDAVKGGMWWWDLATGEIEWDNRMHELFGIKPGKFEGTLSDWKRRILPDDAERAHRRRHDSLKGKRPYDDTYRVPNPSGKMRFIRDRGIVLRNAAGEAIRMVGHCVDVTETVRATQELTESEARFRSLADHAPVLIWMADKNKKLTYFNRQWLHFTGRTRRQERGEGWALGVHPEDRQHCMDAYDAAFRQRQPFQLQFRLRRHDGEYCWMLHTGAPRWTEDGEFLGYVGTCVNITDLNEAMQSLRITQFALDRAPVAIFWVRPDGRFAYVNDEACRALRYSATELLELGVPDVDALLAADRWPAFWERIRRETVVQLETQIHRKDGSEFPADLTIGFLETPAGELACAFARDVTEQRRQQQALRASEERFELAIKGTREGLWDWTLATNAVWFSDRNAEMLGYEPDEWPHTLEMFNKLLHPDDFEHTWAAVRRHFDTGQPYDVEFRLRAKSGEYRWFRSRGIAIRDEEGNPVRMVGSHQDIQDRKEAQFALEASNRELQEFAYIASHDLQEPLKSIAGMSGLLQRKYRGKLDETADRLIDQTLRACAKLQALIRDLVAYTSVEADASPFEPVDMNERFHEALASLGASVRESRAKVHSEPLPVVRGDPLQLLQLLRNLIDNAIKYRAPDRTPEVDLSAHWSNGKWCFAVRDNGPGISTEHQVEMFEIFRRLRGSGDLPGTGIGLAICRKIVNRHGGRIWIESDGAHGTTVKFTLPSAEGHAPQ